MSHQPSTSSGREKLASMRAAEERSARQRKLLSLLAGFVAVVLAFVAITWAVSNNDKKKSEADAKNTAFISSVEKVPSSTFDKVGVGSASNFPKSVPGTKASTKDGKPRIVYYGAEFCPYCAMERWSIVAALSRFGSWNGLGGLVSSEANIPTMNFLHAKYSSQYIDLTTYETSDQNHNTLQNPSAADEKFFKTYNVSKYTGGDPQADGAIPYMTFGGIFATSGATYDDAQDMSGKSPSDIAKALSNPNAASTQGIIGAANVLTAQICDLTKGNPGNVCSSAGVKAAKAKMGSK